MPQAYASGNKRSGLERTSRKAAGTLKASLCLFVPFRGDATENKIQGKKALRTIKNQPVWDGMDSGLPKKGRCFKKLSFHIPPSASTPI